MSADFERDLSDLLHAVTPEPPDHLGSPRVATLAEAHRTDAGATLIELGTAAGSPPRHRHRWPTLVAAAAIAALAAGVVAVTQLGNTGRPPTHQSAGTGPLTSAVAPTKTANSATVRQCHDAQVTIDSSRLTTTHGGARATNHFSFSNTRAKRCALAPFTAAIGRNTTGGTPFPVSAGTIQIPGHGQVAVTAHIRVTGRCQDVKHGLRLNVIQGGWSYSWPLSVTGCTLTPLRLTYRVAG